MAHEVVLPQMGESIAEGTITTWLKQVGDSVERDENLFEMSTDKVDAEIPSPVAGVLLEIKAEAGQTVEVGSVVAIIGEAGESTASTSSSSSDAAPASSEPQAAASAPSTASSGNTGGSAASVEERRRTKSSPLVRKIAREHGVEVADVQGSGISGRVTKADIMAHIEGGRPAAKAASSTSASVSTASAASVPAGDTEIPASYRAHVYEGDRVETMSPMRAKISEHMVWSRRISAHVQSVFEIDFTHVDRLRKKYKSQWVDKHGVKLTFTSFAMKACVDALRAFPIVNASVDGKDIIYHRDINLGLAVALDWGLIVPVVHQAQDLNILGLTKKLNDLATRAREKKLKPHEVTQGTFTITNPGIFGNLFGLPIINQPQVAILGMGGVEKRPVVIDDAIAIRTRAYMSLSYDHRIVDGAVADQFMSKIKEGIQNFDEKELG